MLCGERQGDRATLRCHDSQNSLRWSETLSQDQVLLLQPTITDVQLFLDSYQHDQLSQSQFLENVLIIQKLKPWVQHQRLTFSCKLSDGFFFLLTSVFLCLASITNLHHDFQWFCSIYFVSKFNILQHSKYYVN